MTPETIVQQAEAAGVRLVRFLYCDNGATIRGKTTALSAAFCSRFAIGFLAAIVELPIHHVIAGALVGLLISIPDALITKAYAPILITGILFGAFSGWAGRKWGRPVRPSI